MEAVMRLHPLQVQFARLAATLILRASEMGFEPVLGEAWRSPVEAERQAARGAGIRNSLHTDRLALDLLLFRDGRYLEDSKEYERLGVWWEAQDPRCRWGGRFTRPDGNHFSLTDGERQ